MKIPPITDPMGRNWQQPSPDEIKIVGDDAIVSMRTFKDLPEYSASNPTGVYDGKMWKRNDGAFDREFLAKGGKPTWLLCWYGPSSDPNKCSINKLNLHVEEVEIKVVMTETKGMKKYSVTI